MKTAAVVTVTTGKRLEKLINCANSVYMQGYPVTHYILCDGDFEVVGEIKKTIPWVKVCYWDAQIGNGKDWLGQRWLSAAPHLVTEDVTFYCNDDDWYEEDHVQTIMEKIEQGYDWAYSFRRIHDQEGNFICEDNCEALGEAADVWNIPNHRFVDSCMFGMKTDILKQISIVMNRPGLDIDRHFYATAKQLFPNFTGTGLHTFNFRLGGSCGVQKEFFEFGNGEMLKRFNGKLPWILT